MIKAAKAEVQELEEEYRRVLADRALLLEEIERLRVENEKLIQRTPND